MEKKFIVFEKKWFCTILLLNSIILLFIVQFYCLTQVNKTFHVRAHTKDKKPIFLSGARVARVHICQMYILQDLAVFFLIQRDK